MEQVTDPPDHYYEKEVPWLKEREWKEEDDEDDNP